MALVDLLALLADGQALTTEQTREAFLEIMEGRCVNAEIASFLTALRVRGETVDEIVGAAGVMREKAKKIAIDIDGLLDTCGTGGDHASTFNISTAVAIVVSACGIPVAKHGNKSVSSTSGSVDVLQELGVNIEAADEVVRNCLQTIGLGFFFAPHWHPAMKHVMPVRRALRFRTIFNFLGPLCNPAGAEFQLIGVGNRQWADKLAAALARLGTKSATVVTGNDGLDEVTLAAETHAVCVKNGAIEMEEWTADSFGLPGASAEEWRVGSPKESARVIRGILDKSPGPARDIVLANSAAALRTTSKVESLRDGVTLAQEAIDSGAAWRQLDELILRTSSPRGAP